MSTYTCKDCSKEFDSPGKLGGHRNWCKANSSIPDTVKRQRILAVATKGHEASRKQRIKIDIDCLKCGTQFALELTQYQIDSGKYRKHCERSCANARVHTEETRNKISATLNDGYDTGRLKSLVKGKLKGKHGGPYKIQRMIKLVDWVCENCGTHKTVESTYTRKTCGKECARELSSKRMSERIKSGRHGQQSIKCAYEFGGKQIGCDSKLEYACLNWFEANYSVTSIERCTDTICYADFDKKTRRYTPDFVVRTNKGVFIVECKNDKIGKTLNKKWRLYKELIPFKHAALKKHAQQNGMTALWFTPKMHVGFYQSLFGKDMK